MPYSVKHMIYKAVFIIGLPAVLLLSGCATVPMNSQSLFNAGKSYYIVNEDVKEVLVFSITSDEEAVAYFSGLGPEYKITVITVMREDRELRMSRIRTWDIVENITGTTEFRFDSRQVKDTRVELPESELFASIRAVYRIDVLVHDAVVNRIIVRTLRR